jgi:spore coat polysaccharide biosynthesis predicted glycosyltransferase SpsG
VLLVADAGSDAGLGHLQRSSVLAATLLKRGIAVRCFGHGAGAETERERVRWEPLEDPQWLAEPAAAHGAVVVDSYLLPDATLAAIAAASRLVVFQDVGEPHPDAALVIAPSDPTPSREGRLTGLEHALLSPRFRNLPSREPQARVETVLVTTGAGDPGGRSVDLAAAARRALPESRVLLLRGPQTAVKAPPGVDVVGPLQSLAELVGQADLVVCGGGGTLFEVCAAGVPAAVTVLAPNQAPIVEALARAGAVVRLDDAEHGAEATLRTLGADRERRGQLARTARAAVDGGGAARTAAAIERLLGRRPANR